MNKKPFVIGIVGNSGSGKTTLIEKLLPLLNAAGFKTATIKHTHHEVPLDTPGKDSHRFKAAGACASMLVTPSALQLVADLDASSDPVALAKRHFGEMDIVLTEGFTGAACPKIEVLRAACKNEPRMPQGLVALATDRVEMRPDLPHFAPDDAAAIARFITGLIGHD